MAAGTGVGGMIEKITIEEIGDLFLVRSGERFADHLTKDEVLGVVASALFSPSGPMFVRSYEEDVSIKWSPAGQEYAKGPKMCLPAPHSFETELEYQKHRADANWRALCECRGEEVTP
jgi:hypothetical protein